MPHPPQLLLSLAGLRHDDTELAVQHRLPGTQQALLQHVLAQQALLQHAPAEVQQTLLQQALPVAQALHEPQCSAVLVATQVPSQQVSPEPQALHEPQC